MTTQAMFMGLLVCLSSAAAADDVSDKFANPQQVYRTEVETSPIENGGIVNRAAVDLQQLIGGA